MGLDIAARGPKPVEARNSAIALQMVRRCLVLLPASTGAINFLIFVMSAFAAPAFGWLLQWLTGGGALSIAVFQAGGTWLIGGVIVAIVITLFLERGRVRSAPDVARISLVSKI